MTEKVMITDEKEIISKFNQMMSDKAKKDNVDRKQGHKLSKFEDYVCN